MTTINKSPQWMRGVQIGLGALTILLSIIAMLLPGLTMLSLVILIAIVLVVTGIEKIITGLFISHKSRFLTIGLNLNRDFGWSSFDISYNSCYSGFMDSWIFVNGGWILANSRWSDK